MLRAFRYLFAFSAALFVAGVAAQVFLAGMFLFAGGSREDHIGFGYTLTLVPILVLLLAVAARPGRRTIGLTALLLAVTWLQPVVTYAREAAPFVAALHPVNAMLIFGLGIVVARRALAAAREPEDAAQPAHASA
jgi:hypothetical protein